MSPAASDFDRFSLYTLCVQDPPKLAGFLYAAHGHNPTTLREDFSGPAAICRAWLETSPDARAVAVDMDREPLSHAPKDPRVKLVRKNVLKANDPADIIAALNFPLGYWHTRDELVQYLKLTRSRLNKNGICVFDLYGGSDAFTPCITRRIFRPAPGIRVRYEWEQIDADAVTSIVHNAIHFEITQKGKKTRRINNAFEYHWRLWSIPELIDALDDAGFSAVNVYNRLGDAMDSDGRMYVQPIDLDDRLDANWVVYVAARK
jgi:hypothetical protein